ncbi:MAG TPA: hypothetical protein VGG06_03400 [Thermoanaerobaculia bacterium]
MTNVPARTAATAQARPRRPSRTARRQASAATAVTSAQSTPERPRYVAIPGWRIHTAAEIRSAAPPTHTRKERVPARRSQTIPRPAKTSRSQTR